MSRLPQQLPGRLCAQPPCLSACRAAFRAACLLVGLRLSLAPSLPHGVRWFGLVVEHAQQRERAARRCCSAQSGRQAALSWSVCPLPRYDDPEVKKFKLNAERNNGRAAMMGITGMIVHNALGVDSLFPIVS